VAARLVLVDPLPGRVLRSTLLRGGATALATPGRVLLLVGPVRGAGFARLAVVAGDGRMRWRTLRRIPFAFEPPTNARGYTIIHSASLATDGQRAIVVGEGELVATVDLRTLAVSYHRVRGLMHAHLPLKAPIQPGSAGPALSRNRTATWIGNGKLLVIGTDERPAPGGPGVQWIERAATIVDTRSWRLGHVFSGINYLVPAKDVLLGSDNRRFAGHISPLVAFRPEGTLVYRRQEPLWWEFVAGRLIAGDPYGHRLVELDLHSGRTLRTLGPAPMWPLAARTWNVPGG
jgi:hypothetical protein